MLIYTNTSAGVLFHWLYLITIIFVSETPLMNYTQTDAIPCKDEFVSKSSNPLLTCAKECSGKGQDCLGFVYDFTQKIKITCYLKNMICNTTGIAKAVRFFRKLPHSI